MQHEAKEERTLKAFKHCGIICLICMLILPLSACGSEQSSSAPQQGSYKETKSMVLDILKTEEGRKAIMESLTTTSGTTSSGTESEASTESEEGGESGESGGKSSSGGTLGIKMLLPSQTYNDVRLAVKETMTAPEYKKEIEKIMTDPQFAGDFAKVVNSQSKELHMQLIKDPDYQKSITDIMKSPEVAKMFLDLTKTADYRKQTMTIMQEAMQNPLFKMEVMDLLKTVVQEQLLPEVEKDQKAKDQGGGQQEGGGDGGGGGGGGSGSS